MNKCLTVATILSSFLLFGCANGLPTISTETTPQTKNTSKIFIGIPLLAGMEGSTARLDSEWIVTAAHNKPVLTAQLKDVYYHPTCDIALYRDSGTNTVEVGKVFTDEKLTHIGYPIGLPLSVNEGVYIGEVDVTNFKDCTMSASTGVVMKGQSGGGVYNSKGELVGINHGFLSSVVTWEKGKSVDSPSVFLSLYAVKDWLTEITGNKYFNE